MSELKAFDVVLGRYTEDGFPCVVAIDADRNPRILNEKVYLKSDADKVIARQKYKRCLANAEACMHKRWRPDEVFDYAKITRHMNKWLEIAEKFKPNNSNAK